MATFVVKCYKEHADDSVETRRFTLTDDAVKQDGIFQVVYDKVANVFPDLNQVKFNLFWKDSDNDFVIMSTDDEMRDAFSYKENGTCKFYIKDVENYPVEEITLLDEEEPERGNQGNEGFEHPLPPPPPPPPFPFGRHRHHHHPHLHNGPWGFDHGHFGGPWGWRGMRGPFPGIMGRHRGMHFHHDHHFGNHDGHHCGPWGKGKHHSHHGKKHEWKTNLRAMVPMPHRRWAKSFIRDWRVENLKNATSTSDSEFSSGGKTTMANAGIPKAYADWLEAKLVCWHKNWSSEEFKNDERKAINQTKKSLKESVPKEFRKWTKWYLNSHFGRRDSPKFYKDKSQWTEQDWSKGGKRAKKAHLEKEVPKEYRAWTRKFIQTWRIEKKLDEPNTTVPVSSDSEGAELSMDVGESGSAISIPDKYKEWLECFLPCWHSWRGQLERTPSMTVKTGMRNFKNTVPVEYRAWVKHYLCTKYSKPRAKKTECVVKEMDDPTQEKYQKMLQAFKKKWLQSHSDGNVDSDDLIDSTSEEDEDAKLEGEPESSFKRMDINEDQQTPLKQKVKFNDAVQNKIPMKWEFRSWAKDALKQWDGHTIADSTDGQKNENDAEMNIPPGMYRWMSKMMMKMEMKKMKQEFKAAKRTMKAASKSKE